VGERAARIALHEAERRVRSISLVHEILSRDPSDQVPFAEIVASLIQMAEDSVVSSQPIVITTQGDLGEVMADVATALAYCARLPDDFWTPGLNGAPGGGKAEIADQLRRIAEDARRSPRRT